MVRLRLRVIAVVLAAFAARADASCPSLPALESALTQANSNLRYCMDNICVRGHEEQCCAEYKAYVAAAQHAVDTCRAAPDQSTDRGQPGALGSSIRPSPSADAATQLAQGLVDLANVLAADQAADQARADQERIEEAQRRREEQLRREQAAQALARQEQMLASAFTNALAMSPSATCASCSDPALQNLTRCAKECHVVPRDPAPVELGVLERAGECDDPSWVRVEYTDDLAHPLPVPNEAYGTMLSCPAVANSAEMSLCMPAHEWAQIRGMAKREQCDVWVTVPSRHRPTAPAPTTPVTPGGASKTP